MLDWSKYIKVAERYQYKAKNEDKEDLNHDIIIALAEAQRIKDNNGGGQLSDIAMLRIASYQCQKYWRRQRRELSILSLNADIDDGNGNSTELIETIADDKAIDLDAWVSASTWLLGCPGRLIEIANKRIKGIALNNRELQYLWYWRKKKEQKVLSIS